MNLQHLIGELQALAQAYPPETEVVVQNHDYDSQIVAVAAVSADNVIIKVEIQ
jgi:hypothetical protein